MYYSDHRRHLVCVPYTVAGLHAMAGDLRIKRCWYHKGSYPHYDIPKRRLHEVQTRTTVVSTRTILAIVKGTLVGCAWNYECRGLCAPRYTFCKGCREARRKWGP